VHSSEAVVTKAVNGTVFEASAAGVVIVAMALPFQRRL